MKQAEIDNYFTYHAPSSNQIPLYNKLREAGKAFAEVINECTPPSADQTAAIRKVREAVMTANAAIACDQLRVEIEQVAGEIAFKSYWRTSEQDNLIGKHIIAKSEVAAVGNVRKLLDRFVNMTVDIIKDPQVRAERVWKATEAACLSMSLRW